MPSPNVIAGALTQRTRNARIAVIGNALPLYNPPLRVAEEFAMLDVMSGGRLVAGMVIGGGPEYYSYQVNPTHARERFREALDLIIKAWTQPGPFVRNLLKNITLAPPGYTSARSALAIMKNRNAFLGEQHSWNDIEKGVFALVGSPETVRQQLAQYQKELGAGVVLTGCQTGTLSAE